MKLTVHNLYTDESKDFEGNPASLEADLAVAYPWLRSSDPADYGDLDAMIEHLESSSGYAVVRPSDVDCAAVLVTDGAGRYLFGKRNDNGKYTMPAGHLNPGEDPKSGALRELWEETNLRPDDLTFMTSHPLPGGNFLHTFSCLGHGTIHGKNDPDQECDKWEWIDCRDGVPANIWDRLHGPDGDDNLIRQVFDLKKSTKIWLDAGFMDLRKAIGDLPAGQPSEHPFIPRAGQERFKQGNSFNYDHLLPEDAKAKGYKLTVHVPIQKPYNIKEESHDIHAVVHHPRYGAVGQVIGVNVNKPDPNDKLMGDQPPGLWIEASTIDSEHRKQGLGSAAYEAVLSHGYHHHGARHVRGLTHSSSAQAAQKKVTDRHGLQFEAKQLHEPRMGGIADGAYGDYNYALKTELAKAEGSDTYNLLAHHDPRERALAIKLDTVSRHDLATALLDPNFNVWQAAFNHPDAPLEVLAMHTRDAAGEPIWPRHDLLLIDPRCKPQHLALMHRALQHDWHLPIVQQSARIQVMSHVPQAVWLRKSAEAHKQLAAASLKPEEQKFDHTKESVHPSMTNLANAYHTHVTGGTQQGDIPEEGDLALGGAESKAVYTVPHGDTATKLMVKPYHDKLYHQAGWAEGTSQHLYRAAGLDHLHQKSFVSEHGLGNKKVPATVIQIEPATPVSKVPFSQMRDKRTNEDAAKIDVMDFVTGNHDRHSENLMRRPDGSLLAIDHGTAFSDGSAFKVESYNKSPRRLAAFFSFGNASGTSLAGSNDENRGEAIRNWWPTVSKSVSKAFEERLKHVKDPEVLQNLRDGFASRMEYLNSKQG